MVLVDLERCLKQFGNIGVRTDKNGNPVSSDKGFRRFVNSGKKDGAMASIYSLLGLRAHLAKLSSGQVQKGEASMGVF
jgi:hypothetical protein